MKKPIGINVKDAATARIKWVFDNFSKIYVSFSGGKDSSVMLHLVMDEAIRRNQKVGLLFVDLEAQYKLTIEHVAECFHDYSDYIHPYWVSLPIHLRNAVSQFQPHWICWDKTAEKDWVRQPPSIAITDPSQLPFFRHGMEFEEFVPEFGYYFGNGEPTACFVGIRSDESLNRYRTIASEKKQTIGGHQWTTWCGQTLFNVYPIYDWKTKDIWIYNAKTGKPYNRLYDRMHQAGLSIHQMRICQPYGDDQRKGLHLFQVIEPETWGRVVARVNGANQGALYAQESGNILGNLKISKPENHSWESFAALILESMPQVTGEHYKNKIAVFIKWYTDRGYPDGIPDDGPMDKTSPSWKRICKALLRNDYWCKGLSFTQHKSDAYEKYLKLMKRRRLEWGII
jgi:predicted phosphoadenosine phosphosulfate sulfurtransferase